MRFLKSRGLRFILLFLLLALLPVLSWAKPVDSKAALKVAKGWLSINRAPMVKSPNGNRWQAQGIRPLQSLDGKTVAYVIDLSPKGFIVVPADDQVEPILTFGTEGNFDMSDPGFADLADIILSDIPTRLANIGKMPGSEKSKVSGRWLRLAEADTQVEASGVLGSDMISMAVTPVVAPLMTDTWSQGNPSGPYTYNYYTPNHCVSGCVATAMGMIIHYFRYPASASCTDGYYLDGTWYDASFDSTYDYSLMPTSLSSSTPLNQIQEVAKLLYDCGVSVEMQYTSNSSGAYIGYVPYALTTVFHYTSADYMYITGSEDWETPLKNDLAAGCPVNLGITDTVDNAGHSIVCDGWGTDGGQTRYHLNLGWGSYSGGTGNTQNWYQVPNFSAGGYTWDVLDEMVYNIRALGVVINNGDQYTNSTAVTLTAAVGGDTTGFQMHFSNDGSNWSSWETYAQTKAWTLTDGDGTKTVYFQYKNATGTVSSTMTDTITLDTTIPTCTVSINSGQAYTNSTSADLTISASDAVPLDWMCFSTDGVTWSDWEWYWDSSTYTLPTGDGTKTVYLKVMDAAGNVSTPATDSIVFDNTVPTGSISINSGAATTGSTSVTLTLTGTDATSGMYQMQFSNNNSSWTSWETFATTKSYTLTTGNGTKTVYVKFKDNAGNISSVYNDTIVLDNAPTCDSTTPSSGSIPAVKTTFVSKYSDPDGASDLQNHQLLLTATYGSSVNAIRVQYHAGTNKIYLMADAGSGWLGGFAPGSSNVIENSQCKVYCAETTLSTSGNTRTINWKIEPKSSMVGQTLGEYMWVNDKSAVNSDWKTVGSISVFANTAPTSDSVTPNTGTFAPAVKNTFTAVFSDADGASDLKNHQLLMTATYGSSVNAVRVQYLANLNKIYLMNDAGNGWLGGYAPGASNVIENAQCKVYCAESSTSTSGNSRTVNWKIEFKTSQIGTTLGQYLWVGDNSGANSGWLTAGSITVNSTNVTPTCDSLSPNSGNIAPSAKNTFTSVYSDADGASDLLNHQLLLTATSGSSVNAVRVQYLASTNKLYLMNDAGSGWLGGYAPGASNVIENAQCKLYCAETTTTTSGNSRTINWKIEFKSSQAGKTLGEYMWVNDNAKTNSGWVTMGSITVVNSIPTSDSVSPNSGTFTNGVKTTFTSTYSDEDGSADLKNHQLLFTSTYGSSVNAVRVQYLATTNKIYLMNDAGNGWLGGFAPGTSSVIENAQCKVYCADTSIAVSGNSRIISWAIEFKPTLVGQALGQYMWVNDMAGATNNWATLGSIDVQ